MAPPLLHLRDIALTFGGTPLLDGAELAVGPGERACLVGRNGSGKSTLLKVAAGLIEPDWGERFVQPGSTVRYLPQEPDLGGFPTVLAYIEAGLGPADDPHRARALAEALGLDPEGATARLSGGEARRAALARTLAPEPDILLLDEPTNHLDLPAIDWLEGELASSRSALVLISHDRRFLERLSAATVWLDRGRTRRRDEGFASFESWRHAVLEEEERERHRLDRKIVAEEHWLRYGVTARRKRNERRVAELEALRRQRREARRAVGQVHLRSPESEGSGTLVIEAEGLAKSFGDRPIVRDLSLRVLRGDRLGIVGANGAGKTTLLKLLTGQMAPDAGRVRLGTNLEVAAIEQGRESLDPSATLVETLTGGRGDSITVAGRPRHVMGYLQDFLFSPEQARTPVSALSGGERNRLLLARALARPANLMVLDEPTNDLDLDTLDLLQELLADFPGTLLLVSHDRDFLDRVATSTLFADGEGRWVEYAGGYSDMVAQRGEGVAKRTAAKPAPAKPAANRAPVPQQRASARKLSFNERHALATLPERIAELESSIAALERKLADPDLFARDPAAFERVSQALAKAQAALGEAEDRWLELDLLRQELEESPSR